MCTFRSDHEVMVCDVAIGNVRSNLKDAIQEVEFTTVHGQGTLVRATSRADATRFRDAVQARSRLPTTRTESGAAGPRPRPLGQDHRGDGRPIKLRLD